MDETDFRLKRTWGREILGGSLTRPICGPRVQVPDDACFTARAEGETTVGGVLCIDFKDSRGRRWAQDRRVVLRSESCWSRFLRWILQRDF